MPNCVIKYKLSESENYKGIGDILKMNIKANPVSDITNGIKNK